MHLAHNCPACNSPRFTHRPAIFAEFITYTVRPPVKNTATGICQDCGTVFSVKRFDHTEMADIYKNYRGRDYTRRRNQIEKGYAKISRSFDHPMDLKRRHKLVEKFIGEDLRFVQRVLDYGGDKGQHIPPCFGARSDKYVFEVSDAVPIAGVIKINKIATLKHHNFGFVLCSNVLEHLPRPIFSVKHLRHASKLGALLFIDVPFEIERGMQNVFHEHINFFTVEGLTALVQREKFEVIRTGIVQIKTKRGDKRAIFLLAKAV